MSDMSYEEKLEYITQNLDIVNKGTPPYDEAFLKLICLTCYLTVSYRKKNPKVTPLIILKNAAGAPDMEWSREMYDRISLISEVLILNTDTFPNFNIMSTKEMMTEIKSILDDWIPF